MYIEIPCTVEWVSWFLWAERRCPSLQAACQHASAYNNTTRHTGWAKKTEATLACDTAASEDVHGIAAAHSQAIRQSVSPSTPTVCTVSRCHKYRHQADSELPFIHSY